MNVEVDSLATNRFGRRPALDPSLAKILLAIKLLARIGSFKGSMTYIISDVLAVGDVGVPQWKEFRHISVTVLYHGVFNAQFKKLYIKCTAPEALWQGAGGHGLPKFFKIVELLEILMLH